MKVGWFSRGKHANKAEMYASGAAKYGHEVRDLGKNIEKTFDDVDVVVNYGNDIPVVLPNQIFINVHAGYMSRPNFHRVSVGNYHPGEYMMDIDRPGDRLATHDVQVKPWRGDGEYILVCIVSKFNMALFGINDLPREVDETIEIIKQHSDREIIIRDRKDRFGDPISVQLQKAWAVVTWSSNCAVEGIINGVPGFLRAGAAASPMCLTDLSRIEQPYYPDNREQWLRNLAYQQFSIGELKSGYAWDISMNCHQPRGVCIK